MTKTMTAELEDDNYENSECSNVISIKGNKTR
jgi:hypothetical protein